MVWRKGESGNPLGKNGFTRDTTFQDLCRRDGRKLYKLIWDFANNLSEHPGARIAALRLLVEMGYGKAPQAIRLETKESVMPNMMSQQQLDYAAAGLMKELVQDLIKTGELNRYTEEIERESTLFKEKKVIGGREKRTPEVKESKDLVTPLLEQRKTKGENKEEKDKTND